MVYVKNMDGSPLYPCTNARARILLKQGKAKVIDKQNFTIKLNYLVEFNNKELILKVDTGSSNVGVAVCDEQGDVYFMGQVTLRNDIKSNMDQRRNYRRNRRARKTRYRKPRFLNRGNSIRKGRLSPTMISKLNSHVKIIEYVKTILPITQMVFETTDFDIHAIDHPEVIQEGGGRMYQQSRIDGLENAKAYIRYRDGHKCQNPKCPNKNQKNIRLEVHHKIPRSEGGSDKPDNLITLCEHCHKGIHNNTIDIKFSKKKIASSKGATQTNIISNQLIKKYTNAKETFGYITKVNRRRLKLDKEHYLDAVAIGNNNDNINFITNEVILFRCIADGDYQLSKGVRSEQKINVRKIHGFRKFDKVLYQNKVYFIKGRMSGGYAILMNINGEKQKTEKTPKFSLMKRLNARKTWLITKKQIITRTGDVNI